MIKSYRILSIEACDVYRYTQENEKVGYALPQAGTSAYFWRFKNKLDASLDTMELESAYEAICGKPFSFCDAYGHDYTLAVVNVKFNYKYKDEKKKRTKRKAAREEVGTKTLREKYYAEGFCIDGVPFVRYKRSAGSSRSGKCLFIDARLYAHMEKWGACGLRPDPKHDLASWESYISLSLSSIKGTVEIPPEGILFVPDYKSTFTDEVVSVALQGGELVAEQTRAEITNDIWDGESLLDESVFAEPYGQKHMLLLRNKFFKSCAFRTRLKKWMQDKAITLESLRARGCVTLAERIDQIVMVTTPNSLKYLKFAGGLSQENIRSWASCVTATFGVVKWDKRTRYFGGRMVKSSYQLLNTLGFSEAQAEALLKPSIAYLKTVRADVDYMRYHFSHAYAKEADDGDDEEDDASDDKGLRSRAELVFKLMQINDAFQDSKLYTKFRNKFVEAQKKALCGGHLLLPGTNATLFGNGPELLKFIAGEAVVSELKPGQIRCDKFAEGQRLLCARSPHVTMGNLYAVTNAKKGGIWDYFDLGEHIVCVNAIGENIQQRLNGCDYDSDAMLITSDEMLVAAAEKCVPRFKVPVCGIASCGAATPTLCELDYNTSENKIGDIVNLAQKLNSVIWDKLHRGLGGVEEIYADACKLAVLSGLEIDKAKRAYDAINTGRELSVLGERYKAYGRPRFFTPIDKKNDERHSDKKKKDQKEGGEEKVRAYADYESAMGYIYRHAKAIDFRDDKPPKKEYLLVSGMLKVQPRENPADCKARDEIIACCMDCEREIVALYRQIRKEKEDQQDVFFERIQDKAAERDQKIATLAVNENIVALVIAQYEREETVNWHLVGPIFATEKFQSMLRESRERLNDIREEESEALAERSLHGFWFSKHKRR